MRHKLSIVILLLFASISYATHKTMTVKLDFSESAFTLSTNGEGMIIINCDDDFVLKGADLPCVPFIPSDIAVPEGSEFISLTLSVNTRLIKSNVQLANNPLPIPTSLMNESTKNLSLSSSELTEYPQTPCEFVSTSFLDGITIFHFLTSPFIYNIENQELFFINSITLNIQYDEKSIPKRMQRTKKSDIDFVKEHIANSSSLPQPTRATINIDSFTEYVIITTESLKSSFQNLLDWKKSKGLNSKIITIEEIDNNYYGADLQLKIKTCLFNLYYNYGLSYCLFGGDDTIVPVRGCYGKVQGSKLYEDATIPTDLYYACFDGDFGWDKNGNGKFGEVEDEINLTPSISIARIPIRNEAEAKIATERIIRYEKYPIFDKKMLLSGVKLQYDHNGDSDVAINGRSMYENYIKPYWDGSIFNFYDSFTDAPEGNSYNVNITNLEYQLSQGYAFIDFNTHGNQTIWATEDGLNYSRTHASALANQGNSFIITEACLTNAFDSTNEGGKNDPCLSEAFIRNPYSGIVGYLGSSRYGWSYGSYTSKLGPSSQYSSLFFKNLFDKRNLNKSFGDLVRQTKIAMISSSSKYNPERWLQFSLNPIGDPEMEIFIDTPNIFRDFQLDYSGSYLKISSGVDNCKICVMSKNDSGNSYYKVFQDMESVIEPAFPMECNICVTKSGYRPQVYSLSLIQNESITEARSCDSDLIKLGRLITCAKPSGDVRIIGADVSLNGHEVILDKGVSVEKGSTLYITNKKYE